MKKLFLILILAFLFGCRDNYNTETSEWIKTHKKPIECRWSGSRGMDNARIYTLIDADRNVYNTGPVSFNLPDTIYPIIK